MGAGWAGRSTKNRFLRLTFAARRAARIIYSRRVAEIARPEIYLSTVPAVRGIRDENTISYGKSIVVCHPRMLSETTFAFALKRFYY